MNPFEYLSVLVSIIIGLALLTWMLCSFVWNKPSCTWPRLRPASVCGARHGLLRVRNETAPKGRW